MKSHIQLATLILIGVLGTSAQAQARSGQQLRVDVPFTFTAGNTLLPAGEYRVSTVNPSSDQSVLRITSLDGHSSVMIRTVNIERWSNAQARLTFRQRGEQYFLAEVWMASEATGLAVPQSKSEKSMRRQLRGGAQNYRIVAVKAR